MKEFLKKNFTLVIAFALPVLVIVGIALSAYLPSLFLSTNYNFIYASCSDANNYYSYDCNNYLKDRYSVADGKIVINPDAEAQTNKERNTNERFEGRIFLHDTKKNESREISHEEAQTLVLNSLITSPDGVTVSGDFQRGSDFFFLFDGNSTYGYYLIKGKSKSKLNLINVFDKYRYYYPDNFQFIGWILPGRN